MSGIAGMLRFDGEPVERRDLDRMTNALGRHGPDRADAMVIGSVGFAHVLMRITPEDRFDRQPWRSAAGCVIAADLRLDNRDDILARMGMASHDAMTWADSRVLLTAWETFGDAIWPSLRGPFAVAIWDPRLRVLTLARDHIGSNVVMWHKNARLFAFATMPKGLFALPEVPREFSEEKFADFLVLNHRDHATTVYRNIYRILPAHIAKVNANGSMDERRYWSPADIKPIRLPSDQAYADALRECLDRAVRRQMRSAHPIGCYLSGGLDSSSVAALAAKALGEKNQRLMAFTHVPRRGFDGPVPDGRYADETPYVEAIRQAVGNIDVVYVHNDECDDFGDVDRFFLAMEAPVRNPNNLGWMLAIPRHARAQGRRVLLGGFYGNFTISWNGWSQAVSHLIAGRLLAAGRQWRLYYRLTSHSRWMAFRKLMVDPLIPRKLALWADRRRRPQRTAPWLDYAAILPEFAQASGVEARAARLGHDFLERPILNERTMALACTDYLGDWDAAEKAVTGVEVRDPTADIDVICYCYGVPPDQYFAEDVDRSLIRRAMWGTLPEVVLTKQLIGLQSADWYEKLERRRDWISAQIAELASSPLARRTIDIARLERAMKNWPSGGWHTQQVIDEYESALMRGVAGGMFLRWMERANR